MKSQVTKAQARAAMEAEELIGRLRPFMTELKPVEHSFVYDMREKIDRFGQATFVSIKQLDWLRSLSSKYIKSFAMLDKQPAKRQVNTNERNRRRSAEKVLGKRRPSPSGPTEARERQPTRGQDERPHRTGA